MTRDVITVDVTMTTLAAAAVWSTPVVKVTSASAHMNPGAEYADPAPTVIFTCG